MFKSSIHSDSSLCAKAKKQKGEKEPRRHDQMMYMEAHNPKWDNNNTKMWLKPDEVAEKHGCYFLAYSIF